MVRQGAKLDIFETLTRLAAFQAFRADFIAGRHRIHTTLSFFRQWRLIATTHCHSFGRQGTGFAGLRMTDFLAIMFLTI